MEWGDPFDSRFWVRVAISLCCGFVIGLERQIRGKPAGIRTSTLIVLGTMTFMRVAAGMGGGDPTRTVSQIASGIGFLGAGVIMTQGGLVHGVTSAAIIWVLAAVGAAIACDRYGFAVAIALMSVAVLLGVELLESVFANLLKGVHAKKEFKAGQPPGINGGNGHR